MKIFISIITIISTVSNDLFLPNSLFLTIDNYFIVRKRRPRRPRKPRIEKEKIESTEPPKPKSTCPDNSEDLEILMADLILDLPGYVNREIQRDRQSNEDYLERNIVIAGRPEFEPLPIDEMPFFQEDINQIFLTTLERQYRDSQVVELQKFHWLFLRKSQRQWELVNMFSIEESFRGNLSPQPEDSSNGVFARGIRVWLEKCYFEDRSQESE